MNIFREKRGWMVAAGSPLRFRVFGPYQTRPNIVDSWSESFVVFDVGSEFIEVSWTDYMEYHNTYQEYIPLPF